MPACTRWTGRFAAVLLSSLIGTVAAEDLGQYGRTWPIAEPSIVDQIHDTIRKFQASGEMDRRIKEFKEKTLAHLSDPPPVAGIETVTEPRTRLFDPAMVFDQDIVDADGRVVAKAGVRYNALDYINLSRRYLFIDARDPRQVAWAHERITEHPMDRVVLTAGSWRKLQDEWQVRVFFDQKGMLTTHFGIKRVPSVISQRDMMIQIEEIKP